MLEHYFHQSYQFRAKRRNLRQFKIKKNYKLFTTTNSSKQISQQQPHYQQFVCMSNGNSIEIYKISQQSVDFFMRKQFFCNITKIQVIPSNYHDSDYIFILDDLGRYSFWRPGQQQKHTQNVIQKQSTSKRYYRQQISPEEEQQFSGADFKFDVKDTIGSIFFTIQNKLTLINISIKLKQGLKIHNIRTYQIPYTRFRYVNCLSLPSIKPSQFAIGIIQQIQQKTMLKIHILNPQINSNLIDQDSLSFKLQKTNLLWFSSGQNDQIIILTYDQISIYKYKNLNYLCNYRTRGNYGSVCYIEPGNNNSYNGNLTNGRTKSAINQATYVHLGFQMTVFTKNRLSNYGPLKFEGKNLLEGCGIAQSKYLGYLHNGQIMISFVTNFSQVYFAILYENKWKLVRRIQSLSSIFSLHQLSSHSNPQSLIAVHASLQGQSEITHLQIISPTIIWQEQTLSNTIIQSINIIQDGQSLVLCSQQKNSLLSYSQQDKKWIDFFQFPNSKQQILCCHQQGDHIVMTSGIYKLQAKKDPQSSDYYDDLQLQNICKQANILSAVYNKNYIGYYTSQGNYKFYEFQSKSIARVRKDCTQQYIWNMLPDKDILISAAYNELGELRVLPIRKVARKIMLQTKQLVSSISSISYTASSPNNKGGQKMIDQNNQDTINSDLIIGFHNGDIQIYSLQKNKTIAKFNIGSEMVNISSYRANHLIVYTCQKQYILSANKEGNNRNEKEELSREMSYRYELHQLEMSDSKEMKKINKILYLPKFDKFLIQFYSMKPSSTSQQSTIIQLRSLKLHKKLSDHQLTMQLKSSINMKTIFRTQSGQQTPFVQISNNEYIYIALPENLLKYEIKTKQLIKKQLHLLKQIIAIQKCHYGILVTGIDFMQTGSVVLFDFNDLTIKGTYNLGLNKPTSLKSLKSPKFSNRFFVRYGNYLSVLQIQPTFLITHIKTINTKTLGYTMDINQQYSKIILSDPYRYISVWDYDLQISSYDILPVSKYFDSYVINDCCWLDGTVVTGDRGGYINLLEFNLGGGFQDLNKLNMTKVGGIYVGEEIFTLKKIQKTIVIQKEHQQSNNHNKIQLQQQFPSHNLMINNKIQLQNQSSPSSSSCILYGTTSGSIGLIKTIKQEQFKLLKRIQLDSLKYVDIKQRFSYQQWRNRIPQKDKIIDSALIKYYLDQFRFKITINQEEFYDEVKEIWTRLVGRGKHQ